MNWLNSRPGLPEKVEVDGICHGRIAFIFGMEVVSAIVLRCEGERVSGIAGGLVEVDDSIEDAAGANPCVDGLANLLACLSGIRCALIGGDGGSQNLVPDPARSGDSRACSARGACRYR